MKFDRAPACVTLWFNRGVAAVLVVLLFSMPALLDWFRTLRPMEDYAVTAILVGFYCCAPAVGLALWKLDRLLCNILKEQVFVWENVDCVRVVRWCCLGVCLICVPTAFFYPPLVFMVVIMGFLSLVVNVLCQVLKAAVVIREENDLTV